MAIEKEDNIKIGKVFGALVVAKILDNKTYECKCLCNSLEVFSKESLLKKESDKCSKCKEIKKMQLDNRVRKELYFIWYKFKELYKNPTKKFREEIIDNGIKFFPTIFDKEDGFEFFYNWATLNGYGERVSCYSDSVNCYLDRMNRLLDFDSENCYWTSSKTDSYYKLPKLNEEREWEEKKIRDKYYQDYEEDEEALSSDFGEDIEDDDWELDCGDEEDREEDDDFEIDLDEIRRELKELKESAENEQ